jgi:hypothetical protein
MQVGYPNWGIQLGRPSDEVLKFAMGFSSGGMEFAMDI